jgi:hypothetical protein
MTGTTRLHRMEAEDGRRGPALRQWGTWLAHRHDCRFPGASEGITLHFEHASLRLAEGVLEVRWRDGRTETHGAAATTGGGADPDGLHP